MRIHWLTLLALLMAATGWGADWLGSNWQSRTFLDNGRITVTEKDGILTGAAEPAREGKAIYSIWQPLPEFDPNGKLIVTFQARKLAAEGNYLLVCVSSSPGANLPCARYAVPVTAEWSDCEVPIPLTGLQPGSVFEFIWEGMLERNDKIEVRKLAVHEELPEKAAQLLLTEPANRTLLNGVTPMRVAGAIRPLRSFDGGTWHLTAARLDRPESIICESSGTLTWPESRWSWEGVETWGDGSYVLTLEYADAAGNPGENVTGEVYKMAPEQAGSYVRENTLYFRGAPFIPIGMFHTGVWNLQRANAVTVEMGHEAPELDDMYADMALHGCNTLLAVAGVRGQELNEWAEYAARHGLLVVPQILQPENPAFSQPENLLGWYGADEATGGESGAQARQLYAGLKALAPVSAVFSANYEPGMLADMRTDGTSLDVFLYDKYVIRTADQDLEELARGMEEVSRRIGENPQVVFGIVPQAFIYCGPEPTPAQLRAQIYLGVINGARAYIYYSYNENYGATGFDESLAEFPATATGMSLDPERRKWWLPASLLWSEIGVLNQELETLRDFILADGAMPGVSCEDGKIDFSCREVNGTRYWIAVNLTAQPRQAIFEFSALTQWRGSFGTTDLTVQAGKNPVDFAGYEVKVFTAP